MLIVGGGAALTAIAAYLVWRAMKSLSAWQARAHARRAQSRQHAHTAHLAPGE